MTQISRPFQIALVAVVVLFALWFAVLRGHSSSSESSSSAAAPSSAPTATAPQASASSGSSPGSSGSSGSSGSTPTTGPTYHGSAPGVAGLTRAIAKARGAVTQSQQNAQRLQQKSNQASSSSTQTQAGSPSTSPPASAKSAAEAAPSGAGKTHSSAPVKRARATAGVPATQVKVERELKQGKVVAILLWNPRGSVDTVVRHELQAASHTFAGKLAVHVALAPQVGSFGTFTRAVQVYSTPTILLINPAGIASNVTGLTDAFSIEQAVREAKRAH